MSKWTHVTGAIRVDAVFFKDEEGSEFYKHKLEKILGPPRLYDNWKKSTLPCGSEGSLDYHIHVYRSEANMPWVVISIWGDLRDYDSADLIKKWWRFTLKRINSTVPFTIRDAVLFIDVESKKRPVILYER
jgi:hypothetical protein